MNLDRLNEKQIEAVKTTEGPLLVLAGAGSGKTTVLVNRIAYILENCDAKPHNILAITFTNKAANEMKTRVENLIGSTSQGMWISTFHSACVRILRSSIDRLGFSNNFVIYDTEDNKTVIKECLKELMLDDKIFPPKSVMSHISKAKDEMLEPDDYMKLYQSDFRLSKIAMVYKLYQEKLKKNNALDFDDIMLFTVKILKENEDVLKTLQQRFKYILVDEYQDTSTVQYMLVSMLASHHRNICVVGDDDQSIYKFRGANIRNILDFEKEFSDAKVIKLEQNYRSSKKILNAANSIIKNNNERKAKTLWTSNSEGDEIKLFTGFNEREEARFVADEIESLVSNGVKYSDIAILYRTNAQSRVIEDTFIKNVIPYKILSGLRFYDRKEIKDVIAYLRVILNPSDDVSLARIINEPKRGIGKTTMDKASAIANSKNLSLFQVISEPDKYPDIIRSSGKFESFVSMINNLRKVKDSMSLVKFIERVMQESGYITALELEDTVESQTRIENVKEFLSVAQEFEKNEEESGFEAFLENITLISGIDMYNEDEQYVVMMTIHSAKGLEFSNVFVVGMEDGLFPSLKGLSMAQDKEDLEEERRLCYVAITRAKEKLYLSNAQQRTIFGKTTFQRPSRFLEEISFVESKNAKKSKMVTLNEFLTGKKTTPASKIDANVFNIIAVENNFDVGEKVLHKKFGKGIVLNSKKYGKDTLVEVAFETVGTKQLMANFAKLTKIKDNN